MKNSFLDSISRNLTTALVAVAALGILVSATDCSSAEQRRRAKSESDRHAWREELQDSVVAIRERMEANAEQLRVLTQDLNGMLPSFIKVDNPRHVEGYYVLRDFNSNYPLTSTGLAARLTMSEQLELIAALQGGTFTQIRVRSKDGVITSATVPYDGALNYREGGLNTVAFSGPLCDSVGRFIALNDNAALTLEYLDGNRVAGKITLPDKTKRMVARTWTLSNTRARITRLERTIPVDNRKLESVRARLDQDSVQATE